MFELLKDVKNDNAKGEFYLTDLVGLARGRKLKAAVALCEERDVQGVNSQAELAQVERVFQDGVRERMMAAGVTLPAPETVFFSHDTQVAAGVTIEPNVVFARRREVESGAIIRAFSHLERREGRRGRIRRAVCAPAAGRGDRQGRAHRQLRRGEERHDRRGREGEPPLLSGRWRRGREARTSARARSSAITTASSNTATVGRRRKSVGSNSAARARRSPSYRRGRLCRLRLGGSGEHVAGDALAAQLRTSGRQGRLGRRRSGRNQGDRKPSAQRTVGELL